MKLFNAALYGSLAAITLGQPASAAAANDWWTDIANDRVSKVEQTMTSGSADINAVNPKTGQTPLTQAYRSGSKKVFDLLIQSPGIDLNKENAYGESPIMYPVLDGDLKRVQAMVEKGAQVNKLGWAPIHYAVIKGRADILKYLLSKEAWPNSPAPDGSSPLFYAAQTNNLKIAQILLDAGADPDAMNSEFHSALDVAESRKNQKMIDLLSAHSHRAQNASKQ